MALGYKLVGWNPDKKRYDYAMILLIVLYLASFWAVSLIYYPFMNIQTLIIRSTGSLALLMLHIILMVGPLSRLDKRFLPLLYNRRHLGVMMFLIALIHSTMSIILYHTLGDMDPLSSIFLNNTSYSSLARFPFQPLGFFALIILFLMAATSHDFWLHNLGPRIWKSLHMMVYFAYALIIMHVMLGVVQMESSPVLITLMALGLVMVIGLHLVAGFKRTTATRISEDEMDGYHKAFHVNEIEESRAKLIELEGRSIAVFKYDGKLSAVDNFCKHQNGPLSEGKIIDGCITCPWHGYQYKPEDGCSPPPFTEKLSTYKIKLVDQMIWIDPIPLAEGSFIDPVLIQENDES